VDVARTVAAVHHHLAEPDLARVAALLDTAAGADGRRPLTERKWLDLHTGGRDGFAAVLLSAPHDELVGYAQLTGHRGDWGLEAVVHPEHRTPGEQLSLRLLEAAAAEAAAQGGGTLTYWVSNPDGAAEADARAVGFAPARDLLELRVPLPVAGGAGPVPAGMTLDTFRTGVDDDEWIEVNNRAFAGHHEQGRWDRAELATREEAPWFDPNGFLMLRSGTRLVGSCWTKVHARGDPPLGEIFVISVDPAFHGRRLGRFLTLAGLDSLAARGIRTGMLYVDASNTAARALYDTIGFTYHHTDRAYVREVAPAR